jgi:uncharacterized cupredoxin-like copper-binding protein
MSISHRWAFLLVAMLAAAGVATALVAKAGAAAKTDRVTLSEFKVSPSPKSIAHGRVTFIVSNRGDMEHELIVIRTSKRAARLPVSGGRASEKGAVGEVEDIAAGRSKRLSLNLRRGHYVLLCNLPGHYRSGMRADFTVR